MAGKGLEGSPTTVWVRFQMDNGEGRGKTRKTRPDSRLTVKSEREESPETSRAGFRYRSPINRF